MTTIVDIGSTMVKIAKLDHMYSIEKYEFFKRDYDSSIYDQVSGLLKSYIESNANERFRICSSANGGLRVGIVCLTKKFSGNVARNLGLAAGGNVVFMECIENDKASELPAVDALVVTGGIDCPDVQLMRSRMESFDADEYEYQTLIYAGNSYLAESFCRMNPNAVVVPNPVSEGLEIGSEDLMDRIRSLYLDDIVQKDGVSSLQAYSEVPIWPTPAVVNIAYENIARNGSNLLYPVPCIAIDIGGATTDIHFGLEVVDESGSERMDGYRTCNRHVFTELGVFASKESAITRLSKNDRLYEFFRVLYQSGASRKYADFREGVMDDDLPFYACFFLALDSLTSRRDKSSPALHMGKINSIVITGGASQRVDTELLSAITKLFLPKSRETGIATFADKKYEVWVDGMKRLPNPGNGVNGKSGI
jgi:hypothetical protein